MNLELKRKLSKLLGENIVEEDDATALDKLIELFSAANSAEFVKKLYNALSDEEKTAFNEEKSISADESVPTPVEGKDNNAEQNDGTQEPNDGVQKETEVAKDNDDGEPAEEPKKEPAEELSEEPAATAGEEPAEPGNKDKNPEEDGAKGQEAKNDELFDAKLEAALLRANVREDKLESAKKLFKVDHTIDELDAVKGFVKEYPEWIKQKSKIEPQPFGMDVGVNENDTSPTERRAKELGLI